MSAAVRYRVRHETVYGYGGNVAHSHQLLHLIPREVPRQSCLAHTLTLNPQPARRSEGIDAFGNPVTRLEYDQPHDRLEVLAELAVDVRAPAPAAASDSAEWEAVSGSLAFTGKPMRPDLLEASRYRMESSYVSLKQAFTAYGADCFTPRRPLLEAAAALSAKIHREFKFAPGSTDIRTSAIEAFAARQGVCQDISHIIRRQNTTPHGNQRPHDLPHHAVNLASNGLGRNYVEYNEIRRVCLAISDTGAINSWMDTPGPWVEVHDERSGHVIRFNLIVDVPGCKVEQGKVVEDWTTRGIYLDDYTSNCLVYGNVIVRAGIGFQIHAGQHNLLENNVIVDCKLGIWGCDFPPLRAGNAYTRGMFRANHLMHNIYATRRKDAFLYWWHAWTEYTLERCDENVIYAPEAQDFRVQWDQHPAGLERSNVAGTKASTDAPIRWPLRNTCP